MAPRTKPQKQNNPGKTFNLSEVRAKYINYAYFKSLLFEPNKLFPTVCLLFVLELVINVLVIQRVKYTEIDWKAYMQEVEGVLNGTYDYSLLKGKNNY